MNLKLNKIFKVVARLILVVIGIGLSLYALHVKESKNEDDSYTAHCDISEKISCSAIFTSKSVNSLKTVMFFRVWLLY